MNKLKDFPKALRQKIAATVLIGAGCFLFGAAYWIVTHDRVLLLLSAAVLGFSLYRGWGLYRTVSQGKYETVEGTCVGMAPRLLRRQSTIRVMDDEGIETSLRLGKQAKVKIGSRYRFYFKIGERAPLDSDFLNSMLASDLFLGYEAVEAKAENPPGPHSKN